jgi:hypothetical protein
MDKERLGRALGYGARHAAKTLAQAVDAATSPSPTGQARPAATSSRQTTSGGDVVRSVVEAHRTVSETKSRVRGAAKQAGKSAFAPVAKFSSVLWLEVTGTFFGLVAFAMFEGVWRLRAAMQLAPRSPERMKLYGCVALGGLFVYFAVSNFVRAARRGRR